MFCSIIIFHCKKLVTSRIQQICLDWHQEVNHAAWREIFLRNLYVDCAGVKLKLPIQNPMMF